MGRAFRDANQAVCQALSSADWIISIGYSFGPDDVRWIGWWREVAPDATWIICDRDRKAARALSTRIQMGSRVREIWPMCGAFEDLYSSVLEVTEH